MSSQYLSGGETNHLPCRIPPHTHTLPSFLIVGPVVRLFVCLLFFCGRVNLRLLTFSARAPGSSRPSADMPWLWRMCQLARCLAGAWWTRPSARISTVAERTYATQRVSLACNTACGRLGHSMRLVDAILTTSAAMTSGNNNNWTNNKGNPASCLVCLFCLPLAKPRACLACSALNLVGYVLVVVLLG